MLTVPLSSFSMTLSFNVLTHLPVYAPATKERVGLQALYHCLSSCATNEHECAYGDSSNQEAFPARILLKIAGIQAPRYRALHPSKSSGIPTSGRRAVPRAGFKEIVPPVVWLDGLLLLEHYSLKQHETIEERWANLLHDSEKFAGAPDDDVASAVLGSKQNGIRHYARRVDWWNGFGPDPEF